VPLIASDETLGKIGYFNTSILEELKGLLHQFEFGQKWYGWKDKK
jgi:hypothetical protein